MDERMQLLTEYEEKFKESPGMPWDGFSDKKTHDEYWEIIKQCIQTGESLTNAQKEYFNIELFSSPDVTY